MTDASNDKPAWTPKRIAAGLREAVSLEGAWSGSQWLACPARPPGKPRGGVAPARAEGQSALPDPVQMRSADAKQPTPARTPPPGKFVVRRLTVNDQFKGDKGDALRTLAEEVAVCKRCALGRSRTKPVFGVGRTEDKGIMLVGEAPGHDEDVQGEPFVGAAGQLLDKLLERAKAHRSDVYIGNVLKCRPPSNRMPQPAEVAACIVFLRRQMEILKPAVICALGRHAIRALTGREEPMSVLRGTTEKFQGIPVLMTFHPAYLLRNPAETDNVVADLARAFSLFREKSNA
ncbi:MAG: uracil-DNA glycosylase [Planctomycetota bacterium]|nr:uracil-DNA glycosylase [Planctomycetota bacterium]